MACCCSYPKRSPVLDKLAQTNQANAEQAAAQAIIGQADKALAGRHAGVPADFAAQMFGRVVPEDIVRYSAAEMALLAERAWQFMAERPPATPKVRCETVTLDEAGGHKTVTVVEI